LVACRDLNVSNIATGIFARWSSLALLEAGLPPDSLLRIAGPFDASTHGGVGPGNDYWSSATSGCEWWGVFTLPGDGLRTEVHVQRVDMPCSPPVNLADFNHDAVVDQADLTAFTGAYLAGSWSAEVDRNAVVNANDMTT